MVDISNPDADKQMHIVYETLAELGIKDKPVITAFNKQDKLETVRTVKDFRADYTVKISAKTGEGVDKLLEVIERRLRSGRF